MPEIEYQDDVGSLEAAQCEGFYVGWPNPPSAEVHVEMLRGSSHVCLAFDGTMLVGFVTAISDGVLNAYIPLLEVLPAYQGRGIGKTLVVRLLAQLQSLYSVNLHCDPDLVPFYETLGLKPLGGMALRNFAAQAGPVQSE